MTLNVILLMIVIGIPLLFWIIDTTHKRWAIRSAWREMRDRRKFDALHLELIRAGKPAAPTEAERVT